MDISIVVPLYNEEESIGELFAWIQRVLTPLNKEFEVLFVDDGSSDDSWKIVSELSEKHKEVKGLKFRRNYGKSAALHCGFEVVKGDVVVTMDADLQDSPEEIPELARMITEDGYDLVSGWKKKRYDPITKTLPSKLFNRTVRFVSGIKLHDFNCGLKAYRNEVVKNVEVYGEMHRYIPLIAKQNGFDNIGEKIVQHQERKYGVSKFGIERTLKGFLDLLSVSFITKFGKRPMHLFGTFGTLMFFVGFATAVWLGIRKLLFVYH
jgi:glycosyltransferase involved in cell wall biosynthesis